MVFIMFGSIDGFYYWNETNFIEEYTQLIKHFINLESKPEVFVMTTPPVYKKPPG